jgi:alpha-tubulin suppressor-like RCC1 family protein
MNVNIKFMSVTLAAALAIACSDEELATEATGAAGTGQQGSGAAGAAASPAGTAGQGGGGSGLAGGKGGTTAGVAGTAGAAGEGGADAGAAGEGGSDAGAAGEGGSDAGAAGQGGADVGAAGEGGSDAGAAGDGGSDAGAAGEGGSDAGAAGEGGADVGAAGEGGSDVGAAGEGGSDAGAAGDGGSDAGAAGAAGSPSAPPSLAVRTPLGGEDLAGLRVHVTGTANDDVAVAGVTISIDGGAAQAADLVGSAFRADLSIGIGDHVVKVIVKDGEGQETTLERAVHVGSRVAAGGSHTAAISNGKLYTWGRNNLSQLGLGTSVTTNQLTPQSVTLMAGLGAESVALGQNSSLLVGSDQGVFGFGDNADGQLGLGTEALADTTKRADPTANGVVGAAVVRLGYDHALVLRSDGALVTFGANDKGQLGDGTSQALRSVPAALTTFGAVKIIQVAAGSAHSVALAEDGSVWTFGRNTYGNLGLGTHDDDVHAEPRQVPGLSDVIDVACGKDHVLALDAGGRVWSWGLGQSGQLGHGVSGDDADLDAPKEVALGEVSDPVRVFANANLSFVLAADGKLYGWGQNLQGSLGVGHTDATNAPTVATIGLEKITSVSVGALHVLVRREDGAFFTWGWNVNGSLGIDGLQNAWAAKEPALLTLP